MENNNGAEENFIDKISTKQILCTEKHDFIITLRSKNHKTVNLSISADKNLKSEGVLPEFEIKK